VFLDELTQGLDAGARRDTWRLVEQVRDQGTTVVLVTHFMDEAERLCDRVAVLHHGRIVGGGRPDDVVAAVGGLVHVRFSLPDAAAAAGERDRWRRLPGVSDVSTVRGATDIACEAAATVPVIAEIDRAGLAPTDLTVIRPSLEDAFVALTRGDGRADAGDPRPSTTAEEAA